MTFLKSTILPPVLGLLFASAPAFAEDDATFKTLIEGLVKKYDSAFNAKDAAGINALFAPDGDFVEVNGNVVHAAERTKWLEGVFAMGFQETATVREAHRYGSAGHAIGSYTLTIPGKPVKIEANWTASYSIDGDKVSVKLLTASAPPPPQKP